LSILNFLIRAPISLTTISLSCGIMQICNIKAGYSMANMPSLYMAYLPYICFDKKRVERELESEFENLNRFTICKVGLLNLKHYFWLNNNICLINFILVCGLMEN
jgi:hypothetical protein